MRGEAMRVRFAIFRNNAKSHCKFGALVKQLDELKSLENQLKDTLSSLISLRNLIQHENQWYEHHQTPEAVIRENRANCKIRENMGTDEEKIKSLSTKYRELKRKIENKKA